VTSEFEETEAQSWEGALPAEELTRLRRRSDLRGLLRLAGHLGLIVGSGLIYAAVRPGRPVLGTLAAIGYGFTLVTMFAAMHESIHRTAFRSRWLNDAVGWLAGLLSFYNSTFYRHYHGWHHRFTQLRGRDPELEDLKPTNLGTYLLELSGLPWWVGKVRGHLALARGQTQSYGFLNDRNRGEVVRSVRAQLGVYAAAIVLSVLVGRPLFVTYWLLPVALGQPFLRAILLAEHTGCSETNDPYTNTRTTYTIFLVRFLMWEMPYHAEHHRYPALPFFALRRTHETMARRLAHVARDGYLGFHRALLAQLRPAPRQRSAP
jgi:fatty acid desaturase